MKATVSVIIPTYNRAKILERAIRSVLSQTYRDFEIIIIDDASTDNTLKMVEEKFIKEFGLETIRYVRNDRRRERSFSRNRGLELVRGEYIALLDDDDIWLPQHLEQAVYFLEENRDVGCVFSNFIMIPEFDIRKARVRFSDMTSGKLDIYSDLCITGELGAGPTAVFRREIRDRIGRFNESLCYLEDREFFSRIAMIYKVGFIAEPSVCTYQHAGSYTQPSPAEKENTWGLIEENAKKFGFHLKDELVGKEYMNIAWFFLPNIRKARVYFFKAMKIDYMILAKLDTWNLLFRLALGQKLYLALKKKKVESDGQ